ncbi:MAG: hypothetical protein QOG91_426 [Candidatus Parcubacteria bacterium]|jgi:hypothetical protein|nr:hypothetical protein [Candidatus Parcubacteria bacterium]
MDNPHEKQNGGVLETAAVDRLCECVMKKIEQIEIVRLRVRAAVCGALSVLALIALIPVIVDLLGEASRSGFYDFASLIASDGSYVAGHWHAALLSIADSLPVAAAIFVIALFVIALSSVRRFIAYRSALDIHLHHLRA